jgi:hypothetical protein
LALALVSSAFPRILVETVPLKFPANISVRTGEQKLKVRPPLSELFSFSKADGLLKTQFHPKKWCLHAGYSYWK